MRIPAWAASGFFALALVAGGAVTARADVITLDVSGTLSPDTTTEASCSAAGCTLGGDIAINNTTGTLVSADVTMTGGSPALGPFTTGAGLAPSSGLTELTISDTLSAVDLFFSTPTAGSLIGCTGGPLSTLTDVRAIGGIGWALTSGSLTPQTAVPEPSSLALLLSALAGLGGLLGWRGDGDLCRADAPIYAPTSSLTRPARSGRAATAAANRRSSVMT